MLPAGNNTRSRNVHARLNQNRTGVGPDPDRHLGLSRHAVLHELQSVVDRPVHQQALFDPQKPPGHRVYITDLPRIISFADRETTVIAVPEPFGTLDCSVDFHM